MTKTHYNFFIKQGFSYHETATDRYFYWRNKHDKDIKITVKADNHFEYDVYDEIEQETVINEPFLTFTEVKNKLKGK